MDKEFDKKLKELIIKINDLIETDEIFIYGSYAKKTANESSDIDIACILNSFNGNYLDTLTKLFKIAIDIDSRIEPVLLVKTNDRSGFIEHVKTTGQLLYSRI